MAPKRYMLAEAETKLEQVRHEVAALRRQLATLYDVATTARDGLAGNHREMGKDCGEAPCAICWVEGTAENALAALAEEG